MPRVYQMMKANDPELKENNLIALKFENQSQVKLFEERVKLKLLGYLKTELKNGLIEFGINIGKSDKNKNMIYTNVEKFKYLADMNEKLNTMKLKFGLDFE